MALEVMSGIANTAVEKVMSVGLTVEKTSSIGFAGLAVAVVASVVIANWIWDKILGK